MAVIAGEHHEKLDGSGYPNRLLAPELSLESRIIAVADVYGALSEDRPYRAGLDFEQIVAIMSKLVPRQLDGACFEVLISLMRQSPKVAVAESGSYSADSSAERLLAAEEVAA